MYNKQYQKSNENSQKFQRDLSEISEKTDGKLRFSSISASDIQRAMSTLTHPNKNEAQAVDARQIIDLKVGVAFTRFQTRYFQVR